MSRPLAPWRRALIVAGSQLARPALAALGFWVRYRGWDNAARGRELHAVSAGL